MKPSLNGLIGLTIFPALLAAQQVDAKSYHELGHAILREMVEMNTTGSSGNTSDLAEQLANRFRDMGYAPADVKVVGPTTKNLNFVARYRGTGAHKPILLLAHLDVVEAKREDWTYDPFHLTETGGYFYGRGTQDQKGGAAMLVTTLLRLKQEGWKPDRDIILALTAGEEGGMPYDGAEWLINKRKDLVDAEYVINVDAGGGEIDKGKHTLFDVQAAEKVFHSVRLTVSNPGGHSSLPRKDNAIYSLARALDRISKYDFAAKPNDVVKAYFSKAAVAAAPSVAADMRRVGAGTTDAATIARLSTNPFYNALLRTTCVATMLEGGHAENALPQSAKATVNCRMLPGEDPAAVERTLVRVINDTSVHLAPMDTAKPSPASALRPDLFTAIDASVKATWGPLPIVPIMETGATDGLYFRNAGTPVYGFSGLFIATDDNRMHGKDERILIKAFDDSLDFMYDLLMRIAK
jgi:acetylornithine deacetylase/succinyl-diaminopimelate desuccinylase-like protein